MMEIFPLFLNCLRSNNFAFLKQIDILHIVLIKNSNMKYNQSHIWWHELDS
jgi:hypothetical protein